jgi:hypothetical protein
LSFEEKLGRLGRNPSMIFFKEIVGCSMCLDNRFGKVYGRRLGTTFL